MLRAKKFSLILISVLVFAGCNNSLPETDKSILVIAVSGINADDIGDGNLPDNITPNIEKLVKESVRFTHAYTTSPLENAGFSSLLTGLYPSEHGVRTNGASQFNQAVQSFPEQLAPRNYMTFFLSSGPPVLRKSAVSKGFGDFDDTFKPEGGYFLPASDLADKFLNLFENRIDRARFFGILYFSDFLFPVGATKEKRLQEFDAALGKIRDRLEKYKKWDALTVVFTSMRGSGRFDGLYDEVMRVPLIIKPSRAHRDLSPSWKIDYGISFADLGLTLHSLVGLKPALKSQFDVRDFTSYLFAKNSISDERTLIMESELLKWRKWGPRIFALRQGEWVLFPLEKKLFNTYTDRSQINNLYNKDKEVTEKIESVWNENKDFLMRDGIHERVLGISSKMDVAKVFFSPSTSLAEKRMAFEDFNISHHDWQVTQWYLKILNEKKSDEIKKILGKLKSESKVEKREISMWKKMYGLANKTYAASDCESSIDLVRNHSLERNSSNLTKECRDHETLTWLQSFLNFKAKRAKEAGALYDVASAISSKRRDINAIGRYFWLNNATWDLESGYPEGLSVLEFVLNQLGPGEFDNFLKKKPNL